MANKKKQYDYDAAVERAMELYMGCKAKTTIRKTLYDELGVPFNDSRKIYQDVIKQCRERVDVYKEVGKELQILRLTELMEQIDLTSRNGVKEYIKALEVVNKLLGLETQKLEITNNDYEFRLEE